ncbi:MAG TPA: glutathione synthase [Gammaproteobacteria bacterium]|jgi:glutathione synthase|uniref:Glutathione synthetase n=4 Tax=OM182 clade TaxID=745002 RepID=A0A0R2SEN1_9GAMM|nr:MAG: glutathione synthetase [OM182 bacterium BACL3 MAG-120507-bin80]KRO83237.1 MAG: glutathione synthetase [OM182 bacterium BACL3 MAG-120920-bin41]KRP27009.1 MAG: glutathione synthetase [OM182 bacterium BACL3 MAG-120924-bin41]KRP34184.1 MAG: glutathione synthetase [OM182 bacterium BACL3 MAG-121001-bin29]KRP38883.1 MAG: glutathione synthetase [OM182 bacterium BACL3 MAG-120531-bin86]MBT3522163.1 glutathione synthase [Gammaproteobacteria bacterium]MDP4661621.1 glutathione synthase [OM182 bact
MTVKLGVVMDPIADINVKKDTTLAMLLAAQRRGWELYYMEQSDLSLDQGLARATVRRLSVEDNPESWFEVGSPQDIALSDLDVVLMRKDPPFDMDFIYSTYILEAAQREGTLVVNDPRSLRDCNEKLFATQFPQCCPPLIVAASAARLKAFHAEHGDVIFKPLDGMGGASIFRVKAGDPNLSVIIETLTDHGRQQIMAQKFLPEIVDGDKRILMVDGVPAEFGLARIPMSGETRGNLAAGGSGVAMPLTDRERWICSQVAPVLREKGLLFVGLDVIGDYLTEINVTSPTCVRELDRAHQLDIAGDLMEAIASKLAARG